MKLSTTLSPPELDELCINTLRFLAVDMVQKANSGHPGLPLGSAAMAYTLWDRFLKVNPLDAEWPDRDRFVLSPGHGCALLYATGHVFCPSRPTPDFSRRPHVHDGGWQDRDRSGIAGCFTAPHRRLRYCSLAVGASS